jgi:hypothetical protein
MSSQSSFSEHISAQRRGCWEEEQTRWIKLPTENRKPQKMTHYVFEYKMKANKEKKPEVL